ncbi:XRE family transcriptional regulator [Cryobacterium sp. MLB-32]|uniref:helix-turn-helix domain-containing protein n=1 Tax=Cryobacterium sp. MLB-32 TaxID=1529318 RepID=UPI0004E75F4D|nr:helix-turn-helix transcriptional regulator [Cryobacterium sp. MLB-32]KFF59073.1 XRE family transcriptional regulator [Cryobacterium sp. MLB-32]
MRPMPVEPSNQRAAIGSRLRAARRAQQFTIDQLAVATGLTKGFISRIERDMTSPSVATLVALCEVLNVSIGDLFLSSAGELVTWENAPHINLGGVGVNERLLSPRREGRVQLVRSTVVPGGTGGDKFYTVNSPVDVVHVLFGSLTVQFSDRTWQLAAGDSLTFDGREPHTWVADPVVETELIWVLAPAAWEGSV